MKACLVLAAMSCLAAAAHGSPARFRPGEVLVVVDERSPLAVQSDGRVRGSTPGVAEILERHGLSRVTRSAAPGRRDAGSTFVTLRSDRRDFDPRAAARELSASGRFLAAAPNLLLDLYATVPNDPFVPYEWHVQSSAGADAQLPEAWDLGQGSAATLIAIIDNGIDIGHPDLASQVWVNPGETPANGVDDDGNGLVDDVTGWDFGNHDADPSSEPMFDPSGIDVGFHGTFVAGIAGAATNNAVGIAGAGWNCRIMPLKVGDSSGDLPLSAVTEAFQYAADQGADVLNMSFGTTDESGLDYFQALVDMATSAGVLCVAAAGNDGLDTPAYPAACASVLSVGATTEANTRASFSNWGSWVDVAAPGSVIWSSICRNYELDFTSQIIYLLYFAWDGESPYMYGDGTSFASPLVAGICGLVRAQMPALTPQDVIQRMIATGDVVTYDHPIGTRINAFRALSEPLVGAGAAAPGRTMIEAAMPNPFASWTHLRFRLAESGPVRIRIFDASGRLVREVVDAVLPPGIHSAGWDGRGSDGRLATSGLYFARLEAGGRAESRRLVLAR